MITTERLRLRTMSDQEMRRMIQDERVPELRQAYQEMLDGAVRHPESRDFYALWEIALRDQPGSIVGRLSFHGLSDGIAEIGYGLEEGCCGHGYMTEAVLSAARWASCQPGVRRVEAEVEADNLASIKVLERARFVPSGAMGEEGPRFLWQG